MGEVKKPVKESEAKNEFLERLRTSRNRNFIKVKDFSTHFSESAERPS